MDEIKFGEIENREASVDIFDRFSQEQQNNKRLNTRYGDLDALKKIKNGAINLLNARK